MVNVAKFFAIVACSLMGQSALAARPIIVAVIDTGINPTLAKSNVLCKFGHRDFTQTSLTDTVGHGSHISGLIDQYVKDDVLDEHKTVTIATKPNYCQVIIKFYDSNMPKDMTTTATMIKAIRWAIDINVDVINISAGGELPNSEESDLVRTALDKGIKIVAAAGNDGCELGTFSLKKVGLNFKTVQCRYYPAMYDQRITVVGNLCSDMTRAPSSNYGFYVNSWENGVDRTSYGVGSSLNISSGTSQATAIKTGKIVRSLLKH